MKDYIADIIRRVEILADALNGKQYGRFDYAILFKKSEITISRDLEWLRKQGISIYSKRNVICLTDSPDPKILNQLLCQYLPIKINSLVYKKPVESFSRLRKQNYFQSLTFLAKAQNEKKVVEVIYKRLSGERIKNYKLQIVQVYVSGLNWLIDAYVVGEVTQKTFYVSRLEKITLSDKKFVIPDTIKKSEDSVKVVFCFSSIVRSEILNKVWFEDYSLDEIGNGKLILTTMQPISIRLATWCIGWWDKLQIIEPQELKTYIANIYGEFKKVNKLR